MENQGNLLKYRQNYQPQLPEILKFPDRLKLVPDQKSLQKTYPDWLKAQFPHSHDRKVVNFSKRDTVADGHRPLKVGVVLSGGQAAGGHNVITGIYDALKKLNSQSSLIGFLDGPSGIIKNRSIPLDGNKLAPYRNTGGFDLIGSDRTKIETPEQFAAAEATMRAHKLDGLVIIGGDDSNTNAAFLTEYFLAHNCPTAVVGVPKTIDGDLQNEFIEISFGFDTATKTYSEIISNIARDAMSAKKSYYFIKVMGRSASHIALECAVQTQPNLTLISEEISAESKTLKAVVRQISEVICARAAQGKNYGVIVIPEGIIEFIPEMRTLFNELNEKLEDGKEFDMSRLSAGSAACFKELPQNIQQQLLMDRDPHGNVQVSKIETEQLFIELVKKDLKTLQKEGKYSGKFSAQPFFCGYEGRSAFPSNFDSQYCYALGHVAALLIEQSFTGYMSCIRQLKHPTSQWIPAGIPLTSMMALEKRGGKTKAVITKALVELKGKPFEHFRANRDRWIEPDSYLFAGPIQFFGPPEISESAPNILNWK